MMQTSRGFRTALAALGLVLFITSAAQPARAEGDRVEVGLYGGWHWFDEFNELGANDAPAITPKLKDFVTFGARFAVALHWLVSIEGELGFTPSKQEINDIDVAVLGWRGHLLLHLTKPNARVRPFILAGAGAYTSLSEDEQSRGNDTDAPVYHAGGGFKFRLGDHWGLRLDGRALMPPTTQGDSHEFETMEFEATVGFYKSFGGSGDGDSDNDGVPDGSDNCPSEKEDPDGFEDKDGCPDNDNDGDGLPDNKDKCPNEAGEEGSNGCPVADPDNDGIVGDADKCPDEPEDVDQVQDEDGCPDADNDGDGVADGADQCPAEPETKNGYQDDDGCPDELPQQIKKFTGTIKGIKFKTGSDVILRSSFKVLNEASAVLKEYPDLKLEIQGHTDSQGSDEVNMDLSQRRAESVKAYMVSQGVDEGRLEARGYGETQPIAENKTKSGRAENRRVEFILK